MSVAFDERHLAGYGANSPNPKWPNNARIAISFVVNYEEGGENTPLNGDAYSEVFLNETPGGRPRSDRDMNMWRILRLFKEKSFKFTCYAVGKAVELCPEPIKAMVADGHEIASHQYRWIDYALVTEETEREHARLAINAIKNVTGKAPVGWYSGRISPRSRQVVIILLGF
ncbi:hypothetical protein HK100_003902 [Physocladia obscura]|uniref:NodB homology domain-containing protein n=1 Tax=Physocladia obscura TaxID=109957 RepID=A0AAD5STR3_9FUNG|nr:hypothetical protein HK100_003902 [Physocladia obscura]